MLLVLLVGFVPIDNALSARKAMHVLATMGSKAWIAFNSDIASKRVKRVTKFGYNKTISSGTAEVLASFGGGFLQRALGAETLTIVSTDADDNSSGTGGRQLLISCIDEDGLEVSVVAALNGATPVVTTQTCKFVNRAVLFLAGSSRTNEGTISIVQTTSGVQLAEIPIGRSSTQQLMYYVPSDRRCYIDSVTFTSLKLGGGSAPRLEVNFLVYSQTQDIVYDIRELLIDTSVTNEINIGDFKSDPLRPNEIITLDVLSDQNSTQVTGSMELTCRLD